ncbi:sugar ABC transporter ATP-binding protein [Pseudomonas laurentiana]|uniref:Sugar ABC transporter ATP-binding protein n=1 Tax=Pseudomonas laurentiana TaxID=2364649 RepID=A0A6I5RLA0_9PSED|nr:sugar ABC transporter ATP-binding protein [Pseudomonas laurentiana]
MPALELRNLTKQFGVTRALDGASLRVDRGSVHGLVGENGAGKSTLIKVLAGIHRPDAGSLWLDGQQYTHFTPRQVARLGIQFIHQERLLPASFTVGEALFFGQEIHHGPFVNRRAQQREAERLLNECFDLQLPPGALIGELSSAEQQVVQITRALVAKPKVLVFDEPSVALVQREVEQLLRIVKRLRDQGLAIIYISHYLQEIEHLCDRVTVLRNGRDVAEVDPRSTSLAEITRLMVNRDVAEMYPKQPVALGEPLLQVKGLQKNPAYRDINLLVRRGEIVGLTGLVGSGAKELLKSLFGLAPAQHGEIRLNGQRVELNSTHQAVGEGIALLPEERRRQGVALDLSVQENSTLASLSRFTRLGLLSGGREQHETQALIERLLIKTSGPHARVRQLSGGNQQKVVIGRWLERDCSVLLFDEPTRGIDVGAKFDIYGLLADLARQGRALVVVSSDLRELMRICDRIGVLSAGRLIDTFERDTWHQDQLLTAAFAGYQGYDAQLLDAVPGSLS